MAQHKIVNFKLEPATPEETDAKSPTFIEAFDNTKLTAINTCPTWGIIRYGMHKTDAGSGRAMALEAGSACHEVFAAHRIFHLWRTQGHPELAKYHGIRLFGESRWEAAVAQIDPTADYRTNNLRFALAMLDTSGFYDDPSDKKRTLANLQEACIAYIDRTDYSKCPIWIKDRSDPQSPVGIEIHFNLKASFEFANAPPLVVRFVGRLDGIHEHETFEAGVTVLRIHENKTAARLDNAWIQSFQMSHQVTGYMFAASSFTGRIINEGVVHGLAIPLPKAYDFGGVIEESCIRNQVQLQQWVTWFFYTLMMYGQFVNDPINAPKFTHSCNRYFRPCSMIPFCTADVEEKVRILEQLVVNEWSPLHEKVVE